MKKRVTFALCKLRNRNGEAALLAILAVRAITLISAIAGGVLYLQMKSQRQEEGVSAGVQTGALNRVTTK